ncbi:hypothetical protein NMG60_11003913 [Bertholletia excelsa]
MEKPRNPGQSISLLNGKGQPSGGSRSSSSSGSKQKRKMPTAQELIGHYESQGLETKEASVKVIEDLQKALFRVVEASRGSKSDKLIADTSKKLDAINVRLVKVDMKLDSKPGYGETLAIGVASAASFRAIGGVFPHVARAVANMWNAVRTASTTTSLPPN